MAPTLQEARSRHASSSPQPRPYLLRVRSSKAFILTTICVAVFTDIFLYGIIVPVIPFALAARAGVANSQNQKWVSVLLAVYGAGLLVGSPLVGWYADRSSNRRLPLLFGLVAVAGATLLLCLARTVALLVVGRLLQGLAAAVIWTVGTALLVDTVGQRDIGQMLGYVGLSMTLGFLVAPLLGGVVYNKAGYYPVYYMAFALIFVDIIFRLVLIEKKVARQWGIDKAAEAEGVSTGSETPMDTGMEKSQELSPQLEAPAEQSATATAHETVPEPPLSHSKLPPVLTLLSSRRLLAALWGCIVLSSVMAAFDSVIPLFVQQVFGWTSAGGGLVFLAVTLPTFISPIVGSLSDKYGPRWLTVGGFLFCVPMLVLLRLVTHNSIHQKVLLCALLALIGISVAAVMPPLMAEMTYVVEAKEREHPGCFGSTGAYAQAYGLFVAAYATGSLIGPLLAGYVRSTAGWGTMAWCLGLFCVAGAVPCLIWTGGFITEINAKSGDERAIGRVALIERIRRDGDQV